MVNNPEVPADARLLQLVNGVIWPGFHGTTAPSWLACALAQGLAGVVYFSHNIDPESPEQVAALSGQIRAANPRAVIGIDEEGGNVTRLQARDGSGIPGAAVLGRLDDEGLTEAAGRAIGDMCRAAGINLALAPVADVNTNPLNPVIGVRSFGSDTALVGRHTAAMVRGIQSTGVGACAKHFPGHGDTMTDSHLELPHLELTPDEVERDHLPPFRAAVQAGVAAVMSAHIVFPGLGGPDAEEVPATLNPAAGELLRSLGFAGLQITDALDMAAIRASVGSGPGAVQAVLAGADLLCVGNPANVAAAGNDEADYLEVRDALLAAVGNGSLPVSLLERAAGKVAAFAAWSSATAAQPANPAAEPDWVAAARRACTLTVPGAGNPPLPLADNVYILDVRNGHNMAAGPGKNFLATALASYTRVRSLSWAELPAVAGAGSSILMLADSLAEAGGQLAALRDAAFTAPLAICINAGVPAESGLPFAVLNCYGFSRVSAEAVAAVLTGH